eukprot:CAMPEP_0196671180 /NCGR_PEP_ID=MMETSP1090-20130531/1648_1 /TAXON_ID=37098 /ORGANISM="Isochrysis sp, Strain CCMP1244" /LENGTH=124 /DNA_ID=CAMNT_0042008815 /DNA_START=186 /DNA_END=560 /DNA_ORIENTATION=+
MIAALSSRCTPSTAREASARGGCSPPSAPPPELALSSSASKPALRRSASRSSIEQRSAGPSPCSHAECAASAPSACLATSALTDASTCATNSFGGGPPSPPGRPSASASEHASRSFLAASPAST